MKTATFELKEGAVEFIESIATLCDISNGEALQLAMGTLKIIVDAKLSGKTVLIVDPITDETREIRIKDSDF